MRPTYAHAGDNYLPAIIHDDGRREIIYGDPLATIATARKYASLHIYDRIQEQIRKAEAMQS